MNAEQIADLLTPAQVRVAAYGLEIPEEAEFDAQLDHLIERAARRLLQSVPQKRLTKRLASGRINEDSIRDVLEDMVLRVVRNPSGYRQFGIDDFQATLDEAVRSGALYVSPSEISILAGRKARNFGTIRTEVPAWRLPRV